MPHTADRSHRRATCALVAALVLALAGCVRVGSSAGDDVAGRPGAVFYAYVGVADPLLYAVGVAAPPDGASASQRAEAAVRAMATTRVSRPFSNLWAGVCAPARHLESVSVGAGQVLVHFSDEAAALCDWAVDPRLVAGQQLAWTVRVATGSSAPVVVTVGDAHRQVLGPVRADPSRIAPTQ